MRIVYLLLFLIAIFLGWAPVASALTFNDQLVDAADIGDKDKVIRLLKQGQKPDSRGDFAVTPLMRAAFRGYKDIAEILIESGAYVNASDIGGETALHLAARNGNDEMVRLLIHYDAYVDIPDKEKWTPLMRAVMAKKTKVAEILIDKGADLNKSNNIGESVLVHASIAGRPEILGMILRSEKFQDIAPEQKQKAIDIADRRGNEKLVTMISRTIENIKMKLAQEQAPQSDIMADKQIAANESKDFAMLQEPARPIVNDEADKREFTSPASQVARKVNRIEETPAVPNKKPVAPKPDALPPVSQITKKVNRIKETPTFPAKKPTVLKPDPLPSLPVPQKRKERDSYSIADAGTKYNAPRGDLAAPPGHLFDEARPGEPDNKPPHHDIAQKTEQFRRENMPQKKGKQIRIDSPGTVYSPESTIDNLQKIIEDDGRWGFDDDSPFEAKDVASQKEPAPLVSMPKTPKPTFKPIQPVSGQDYNIASDSYSIQLGSFSSQEQALFIWNNIKSKNPDILSNLSPKIEHSKSGKAEDMYRLRVGEYKWKDVAERSCADLKSRNVDCFVIKVTNATKFADASSANKQKTNYYNMVPPIANTVVPQVVNGSDIADNSAVPIDIVPTRKPSPAERVGAQDSEKIANAYLYAKKAPLPAEPIAKQVQPAEEELPWLRQSAPRQDIVSRPIPAPMPEPVPMPVPQQDYNNIAANTAQQPIDTAISQNELPWQKQIAPNTVPRQDIASSPRPQPVPQQDYNNIATNASQQPIDTGISQNELPWLKQPARKQMPRQDFSYAAKPQPTPQKNYNNFYKSIEENNIDRDKLSEAVLVKDRRFSPYPIRSTDSDGLWLEISSFPNAASANDYGDRMFRYDESLGDVQIRLTYIDSAYGSKVHMRVGPIDTTSKAASLCNSVRYGGMSCQVTGKPIKRSSVANVSSNIANPVQQSQPPVVEQPSYVDFWINLGTFSDSAEAEYYWAFIKEDNTDILGVMGYKMEDAGEHGEFRPGAVKLLTGPFNNRNRADKICRIMRYRNIACLVVE